MTAQIYSIHSPNNPGLDTVRLALHEALGDLESSPEFKPQKVLILILDDTDFSPELAKFQVRIHTGGMRTSEGLSILEVAKARLLSWMGYPEL